MKFPSHFLCLWRWLKMSAASNYYSGSYDYNNGGNIYVHLHVQNIGRAMNGSSVAPS